MNNSNAVIVGRVQKPLEVKKVNVAGKEKTVGNMSVRVDKPGSKPGAAAKPTFYDVAVWNAAQQEELAKLKTGDSILVRGELEAKKYEKGNDNGLNLCFTDPEVTPLGNQDVAVQSIVAVGRATQDVELSETPNGHKVAKVYMALNHSKDKTSYVEVEVWDGYAEQIAKSVKKGSLLTVSGELDLNTYGNTAGGKTSKLRIANAKIGFMDKSAKAGAGASGQAAGSAGQNNGNAGR